MEILTIQTQEERDVVDITDLVNEVLARAASKREVCHLFVRHTMAAITTTLLDREKELDLIGAVETSVVHPAHAGNGEHVHTHHKTYLPPDICAALIGSSLVIPVDNGKLSLGKFQRAILLEFEGPSERQVVVA